MRGRWSAWPASDRFDGSWASGTVPAPVPPFGFHWCAPAGLFVSFPFVAEQVPEEVVAPLRWRAGPGDFEPLLIVSPPCLCQSGSSSRGLAPRCRQLPVRTHQCRIAGTVGLAEGVTASDESNVSSSFIAMRAKVSRISRAAAIGSGLPFRAFRIDVNQAHLHGTERIFRDPGRRVAFVTSQVFSEPQ